MRNNASDFMHQEYDRISKAYFGLSNRIVDMLKVYLALLGLPLTALAALGPESGGKAVYIDTFPPVVAGLLLVLALLGFLVALTIVSMRLDQIMYARTINSVRRYFADIGSDPSCGASPIVQYLVLPTSDAKPAFFEAWRTTFWQVVMLGIVNGIVLAVGTLNFGMTAFWAGIAGLGYLIVHILFYAKLAKSREARWTTRFPSESTQSNF